MAEPVSYLVEHDSFKRIAKAVRFVEREFGIREGAGNDPPGQDSRAVPLLITADDGGGFYRAQYLVPVEDPRAFTGIDGVVYARELNGAALTVGKTYHGFLYGGLPHDEGGGNIVNAPLYSVQASGGGSSLDCPRVSGVTCTSGILVVTYGTSCDKATA